MARFKIENPVTRVVGELLVFTVVTFSVDMLVSDTTVASALTTSAISGVLFVVFFEWLNRRLRG